MNRLIRTSLTACFVVILILMPDSSCADDTGLNASATAFAEKGKPKYSKTYLVSNKREIESVMKKVQPGEAILLKDGIYRDLILELNVAGTKDKPITLAAVNPGKAYIKGASGLVFKARHWVVRDLFFNDLTDAPGLLGTLHMFASNQRVTNCVFMQEDTNRTFLWTQAGTHEGNNHEFVRYVRLDHCIFIAAGKNSVRNWQNAGRMFRVGGGKSTYAPGYGTISSTRYFSKDTHRFGDAAYWRNFETPAYVRIDHSYLANPRGTTIFYSRHEVTIDVPSLAKALKVPLDKVHPDYRNAYIDSLTGTQLDSNLIDMKSYNNIAYFKAHGTVMFGNTFHNMRQGEPLWSRHNAFIKNHVLDHTDELYDERYFRGHGSLSFQGRTVVAGNYIDWRAQNPFDAAAIWIHDGREDSKTPSLEGLSPLNHHTLFADNVVNLMGQGDKGAVAFRGGGAGGYFDLRKPASERKGKLWESLAKAYGGMENIPDIHRQAYNCDIINNVVYTRDAASHTLLSQSEKNWKEIFAKNRVATNYATESLLTPFARENGFLALPRDWNVTAPQRSIKRTPIPEKWKIFNRLPIDMQALLDENKVVHITTSVPNYYQKHAMPGLREVDQGGLGDTLSLRRPIDFKDVGPTWFDKSVLRRIGMAIRNPKKEQLQKHEVNFPLPAFP